MLNVGWGWSWGGSNVGMRASRSGCSACSLNCKQYLITSGGGALADRTKSIENPLRFVRAKLLHRTAWTCARGGLGVQAITGRGCTPTHLRHTESLTVGVCEPSGSPRSTIGVHATHTNRTRQLVLGKSVAILFCAAPKRALREN